MAIPLTGDGGIFTRWGRLMAGMDDCNALIGGTATDRVLSGASFPARLNNIHADFVEGDSIVQILDMMFSTVPVTIGSGFSGVFSDFRSRIIQTLQAMYSIDKGVSPLATTQVLTNISQVTALRELIRQMTSSSDSVNSSTPSAGSQTDFGTPNGTPSIVVSVKNRFGQTLQYALAETLTFSCTSDSQIGSTLGQEPMSVTGMVPVSDSFSPLWPGGSGTSVGISCVDGSKNNTGGNLLYNSSFETFTSNSPEDWVISAGSAGVTVFNGSADGYDSNGALKFTGDGGGTLIGVTQEFNKAHSTTIGAGGTPATLLPSTQYAVNAWTKVSATPSAGVLQFSLIDGSDTIIADGQSTNNVFTKALTGVSTTYVKTSGVFRTPAILPSTIKLRIRLSTAIDSGKSVFVDRVGMSQMDELYSGGPSVKVFSGATKLILNDSWTVAISQTWGAFQKWLERLFGMKALGLIMPNSGSPTINDNLIA